METTNQLKAATLLLGMLMAALASLHACSSKVYTQTTEKQGDTVDIRVVPVEQLEGIDLAVGQKLSIPDLDIELVRVSDKEVLVKTPVRTTVRTETTFVPVRKVDKSRTKVDNSVRTVDKSRTKEVDKSRTDSGNKTKVKSKERSVKKDKQVQRNTFPWWLILLAILLGITGWGIKNRKKLPFLKWLPF